MATVLVTGGAGFIGSHLTESLLQDGYKVVVVDNLSSGSSAHISNQLNFAQMELTDKQLGEVFSHNEISYVYHLAAQTNVPQSVSFPVKDTMSNVLGTVNLLDNCLAFKVKKFIYLSGGAALYGETPERSATETDQLAPISPLGLSKAVAEKYIEWAARTAELDYTILRCSNIYGPRQDPYREVGVVASFCNFLLHERAPTIYGDGSQMRDFLYIDDLCVAMKQALVEGRHEIVNIGSGTSHRIIDILEKLQEITGFSGDVFYRPARSGEVIEFKMNIEKASRVLKWRPGTSLESGLQQTVDYYRTAAQAGPDF